MRHSGQRFVLALSVPVAFAALEACSAEGSENKTFGPSFDVDASTEGGASGSKDGGGPGDAGGLQDSGSDGSSGGPDGGDASACTTGQIAVLSGSGTGAQGSTYGAGGWSTSVIAGAVVRGRPAIVSSGSSFVGVVRDGADALQGIKYAGAWSGTTRIGTRTARDTHGLAAIGGAVHLAYQDSALYTYFHGVFDGAAWDAASSPVQNGGSQSFGPRGPSAVATGAELAVVSGGDAEGPLYVQSLVAGAWGPALPITGTNVCGRVDCGGAPAAIATAGTNDLLAIHIDRDTTNLIASVRKAADKTWTTQGPIRPTAPIATTVEAASLALATPTRAVVVFRGTDQKAYASVGDLAVTPITWTPPVAIATGTVAAPPVVAPGACGDDAVAVVVTAGEVRVTRLRGAAWSTPESVPGTNGATAAAIASNGAK